MPAIITVVCSHVEPPAAAVPKAPSFHLPPHPACLLFSHAVHSAFLHLFLGLAFVSLGDLTLVLLFVSSRHSTAMTAVQANRNAFPTPYIRVPCLHSPSTGITPQPIADYLYPSSYKYVYHPNYGSIQRIPLSPGGRMTESEPSAR
ncbi:hypothetical protein OH77DRAFT_298430 [Trametes cingulata]|nr:hypothetical protein OH77DRAFT_298430 [Trametes cingulata]